MKKLIEIIKEAEIKKTAIGHFNISDLVGLRAVFESAKEFGFPIIIGVSEGERGFIGTKQIAALVKSLKEEYNYPVFLNADHTKSLEKIKEAVEAGFDAVMFDGSELPLEENIKKTKEAVNYVKNVNPEILVEAELGYIRGSSIIFRASDILSIDDNFGTSDVQTLIKTKEESLTEPNKAKQFVKETGIDLLAPAVGNIHGIITRTNTDLARTNAEIYTENPNLNIERIKEIRQAVDVPLVLHGGSGITNNDFLQAIDAGASIIHINTELRLAWRRGLEKALKEKRDEIAPYKILPVAMEEIKKIVEQRLKLFNKMV